MNPANSREAIYRDLRGRSRVEVNSPKGQEPTGTPSRPRVSEKIQAGEFTTASIYSMLSLGANDRLKIVNVKLRGNHPGKQTTTPARNRYIGTLPRNVTKYEMANPQFNAQDSAQVRQNQRSRATRASNGQTALCSVLWRIPADSQSEEDMDSWDSHSKAATRAR